MVCTSEMQALCWVLQETCPHWLRGINLSINARKLNDDLYMPQEECGTPHAAKRWDIN